MAHVVVVDSSTLLADLLPNEPLSQQASTLLAQFEQAGTTLAAPALCRYELVAVLRRSVNQRRIGPQEGQRLLTEVLAYPIDYYLDNALLQRGYELATLLNRPSAYDAQYLALAERLGCECWTADERLYNAARSTLTRVQWVGRVAPPQG